MTASVGEVSVEDLIRTHECAQLPPPLSKEEGLSDGAKKSTLTATLMDDSGVGFCWQVFSDDDLPNTVAIDDTHVVYRWPFL